MRFLATNIPDSDRDFSFSQIVFSGDNFRKTVNRKEIIAYSQDYDKYKEAFLRALKRPSGRRKCKLGNVKFGHISQQVEPHAKLPTSAQFKTLTKKDSNGVYQFVRRASHNSSHQNWVQCGIRFPLL